MIGKKIVFVPLFKDWKEIRSTPKILNVIILNFNLE